MLPTMQPVEKFRTKRGRATKSFEEVRVGPVRLYFSHFELIAFQLDGAPPVVCAVLRPITVDMGPDQAPWTPRNFDNKVFGPTTIRVGLEQSHDLMTVRLGVAIGLDAVGGTVEKFGVMDRMPREPSTALTAVSGSTPTLC